MYVQLEYIVRVLFLFRFPFLHQFWIFSGSIMNSKRTHGLVRRNHLNTTSIDPYKENEITSIFKKYLNFELSELCAKSKMGSNWWVQRNCIYRNTEKATTFVWFCFVISSIRCYSCMEKCSKNKRKKFD